MKTQSAQSKKILAPLIKLTHYRKPWNKNDTSREVGGCAALFAEKLRFSEPEARCLRGYAAGAEAKPRDLIIDTNGEAQLHRKENGGAVTKERKLSYKNIENRGTWQ